MYTTLTLEMNINPVLCGGIYFQIPTGKESFFCGEVTFDITSAWYTHFLKVKHKGAEE